MTNTEITLEDNLIKEVEVTYGLIDQNDVLMNSVLVKENDFTTLDLLVETHNAKGYHLLDPELYRIEVGNLYWNQTHWDLIKNRS